MHYVHPVIQERMFYKKVMTARAILQKMECTGCVCYVCVFTSITYLFLFWHNSAKKKQVLRIRR